MAIQKPYLEGFSANELMQFIDHYVQTSEVLHVPGHAWEQCDQLAQFLGFGYSRNWTDEETNILICHYPNLGAEETALLLPMRTPDDCTVKASNLRLTTSQKKICKQPSTWTRSELKILAQYYPIIGSKAAILLQAHDESSCRAKAAQNKISKDKRNSWTKEELNLLRRTYPKLGKEAVALFPNRAYHSVIMQASRLSLSSPAIWLPEEDELLKLRYPEIGREVSKYFHGRHSTSACQQRASKLGLHCARGKRKRSKSE